jgi:hypothetical protein
MTFLLPFFVLESSQSYRRPKVLLAASSFTLSSQRELSYPGGSGGEVLRQRDVSNLNIVVCPLVEELDASNLGSDILGEDLVSVLGNLNFDVAGFRHDCG